jgi:UDP-N-acetylmuramoyl-tripeptide--D-alanyl-D-alanine ligase
MAERSLADVLFYGVDESADLKVSDINGLGFEGVEFVLHFGREKKAAKVPMLGKHSVYTALRAAAVGLVIGMSLDQIVPILEIGIADVRLSASYSNNGAKLLNDTYNASPQSTLAALQLLDEIPGRKIAVLGDMLELGRYETEGHASVGEAVADIANLLVTIGSRAETIAESAQEKGLANDAIHRFADSEAALNFLRQNIEANDVLLVKGSRAMQMENIVPELEALP